MASATQLEFEKPIAELERQIDEIKKTAGDSQLSVAEAKGRKTGAAPKKKAAEKNGSSKRAPARKSA